MQIEAELCADATLAEIHLDDDGLILGQPEARTDAHFVYRFERVGGAHAEFAAMPGAHDHIAKRFRSTRP